MIHKFAEQQIQIARVYYCSYHPIRGVGRYKYDSQDRKPKPGLLLRAQAEFSLDLTASVLIGDQPSDIYAANVAGIGTKILLRSEAGEIEIQEDHDVSDSLDDIRQRFFSPAL